MTFCKLHLCIHYHQKQNKRATMSINRPSLYCWFSHINLWNDIFKLIKGRAFHPSSHTQERKRKRVNLWLEGGRFKKVCLRTVLQKGMEKAGQNENTDKVTVFIYVYLKSWCNLQQSFMKATRSSTYTFRFKPQPKSKVRPQAQISSSSLIQPYNELWDGGKKKQKKKNTWIDQREQAHLE